MKKRLLALVLSAFVLVGSASDAVMAANNTNDYVQLQEESGDVVLEGSDEDTEVFEDTEVEDAEVEDTEADDVDNDEADSEVDDADDVNIDEESDEDLLEGTLDISDDVLQFGGTLNPEVESINIEETVYETTVNDSTDPRFALTKASSTNAKVAKALKKAFKAHKSSISLKKYKISVKNFNKVLAKLINSEPSLFYIGRSFRYTYTFSGYVVDVNLSYVYTKEQAKTMTKEYNKQIAYVKKEVKSSWSDLEKAMYIHDYIIRNCAYDYSYTKYDAYNTIVTGSAVCQGYALAFKALAKKVGLNAQCVTSDKLNHAWNLVQIKAKYKGKTTTRYFLLDATWDDPGYNDVSGKDLKGCVNHKYFLKSLKYFKSKTGGHNASDWVVQGSWKAKKASSKMFDKKAVWESNNCYGGFDYVAKEKCWYTNDATHGGVSKYKYNAKTGKLKYVSTPIKLSNMSKFGVTATCDGDMYVLVYPGALYKYDTKSKSIVKVLDISSGSVVSMNISKWGDLTYAYLSGSTVYNTSKGNIAKAYTIKYKNVPADVVNNNPISYTVNNEIKLNKLTRTGYDFKGWYSDKKYKKKVTKIARASYGKKTLYAKWAVHKYSIKFKGNGSTSGKTKTMKGCKYGKTYTLTKNKFKKKGYKFIGWNTSPDGRGTTFSNKAKVSNLTDSNKGSITLYAMWEIKTYSIKYELKGGTNSTLNPAAYNVLSADIVLQAPVRAGYSFKGWYADKKYKKKVSKIKTGSTGNKTLYAKWEPLKYTIVFAGNGATSGMTKSIIATYGKKYALTNKFKRAGYKFAGWNTAYNGTGTAFKNKQKVKNLSTQHGGVVIIYAQWVAK